MELFVTAVILTILGLVAVIVWRKIAGKPSPEALGIRPKPRDRWTPAISLTLIVLGFLTVWIFLLRDGLEGAQIAWQFVGPLLGSVAGYWVGRPK